jgi:hypothetical protein
MDGKMIGDNVKFMAAEDIKRMARRGFYAQLIPMGWRVSGHDLAPL